MSHVAAAFVLPRPWYERPLFALAALLLGLSALSARACCAVTDLIVRRRMAGLRVVKGGWPPAPAPWPAPPPRQP